MALLVLDDDIQRISNFKLSFTNQNETSFIRDMCCHLMLCLHLIEPIRLRTSHIYWRVLTTVSAGRKNEVSYYNETNGELRFLWLTSPLLPVSAEPSEPLFSIIIKPERDGNLSDFISTEGINFLSEAVSAKLLVSKVSVDFILEERPSSTSESKQLDLKVSPNPIRPGPKLTIKLNDNTPDLQKIQLLNLAGQSVFTYELSKGSEEIDIPANISSGIYILRYKSNGGILKNMKLIVIE